MSKRGNNNKKKTSCRFTLLLLIILIVQIVFVRTSVPKFFIQGFGLVYYDGQIWFLEAKVSIIDCGGLCSFVWQSGTDCRGLCCQADRRSRQADHKVGKALDSQMFIENWVNTSDILEI